jgi:hypothetical protein
MTYKLWGTLLAVCIALGAPGLASADISSLDAYAGEAAVLGKPHRHHHARPGGHSIAGRRRASAGGGHTAGGTSPGGRSHSGTQSPSERGRGAAGGSGAGSLKTGGGSRGSQASSGETGGAASGEPSGSQGLGARNADSSTSSLTSTDVIVLCALAVTLLGSGAIARRLTRE